MSQVKKANFNGFYVEQNPRFSFSQLDGINDNVCEMGWALNQYVKLPSTQEVKAKIQQTVEKVATKAVSSAQDKLVGKVANAINPPPPPQPIPSQPVVAQTPEQATQEAMQTQGIVQTDSITKFITQPLDPNVKIALIAGGSLVGLVLLLTTIKSLTR